MQKFTQRELRNLVACGTAKDITNARERNEVPEGYSQIGYSCGIYGCNGMLLEGDSGQLYAVTARTTAIYLF